MNQTFTIARRELISMFCGPIAYVVLAVFALGTSLVFFYTFGPGQEAEIRGLLGFVGRFLLPFIVPAVTMRLVSEEIQNNSIELLMTSPVTDAQVIMGKFLGALAFLAVTFTPLLFFVALLEAFGDPERGPIFTGILGLFLISGFYLAIGTFCSTLTQVQIVSFIVTLAIILTFTMFVDSISSQAWGTPEFKKVMFYLSANRQFDDFGMGRIDLTNILYFASGIGLFLFLATVMLQSRRWR